MINLQHNLSARWKVSRYITTILLDEVNILLIFGGLGGRLIEIPQSHIDLAARIMEDPNQLVSQMGKQLHQLLCEQGILIPEDYNELLALQSSYSASRHIQSSAFGLTICPTINCNLRCVYCFQRHYGRLMPIKVQNSILDFVYRSFDWLKTLIVSWYGGEPLLGLSVIESLSNRFINLENQGIKYNASIITNGWLLSNRTSRSLVDYGVQWAQITLDGPKDIHDTRRCLSNGLGTFDRILENIGMADPRLKIVVRVNTDSRNVEHAVEVLDQLDDAGLRGRVSVYFAPVRAYTDVCLDNSSYCFGDQEWAAIQSKLQLIALERGYGRMRLPSPLLRHCMADSHNGIAIVPSGLVFKCWTDVTHPERAIFDISDSSQTDEMKVNLRQWLNWSPFNYSECASCPILPYCMGGCPHVSLHLGKGDCKEIKYNMKSRIATWYLGYKKTESAKQLITGLRNCLPEDITDLFNRPDKTHRTAKSVSGETSITV